MNLRQIEIFHAVYLHGTVSAAARALNVSQPAVTKVLRHAERAQDVALRVGRGMIGELYASRLGKKLERRAED